MDTLNSQLGNLSCAGSPFMKLNFEHKAVTSAINKKVKTIAKLGEGGKILRNPSRQIPKWEILEKKRKIFFFGKINAHKEE